MFLDRSRLSGHGPSTVHDRTAARPDFSSTGVPGDGGDGGDDGADEGVPLSMRIEHTRHIDAPTDVVWAHTIAVESWPDFLSTVEKVQQVGDAPLCAGSAVRVKQPGQRERVWTVVAVEPNRRFVWSTRAMGMTMTATHQLGESGTGTHNHLIIELHGRLAPVLGRLLTPLLLRSLTAENQGFTSACEGVAT